MQCLKYLEMDRENVVKLKKKKLKSRHWLPMIAQYRLQSWTFSLLIFSIVKCPASRVIKKYITSIIQG